MNTIKWVYLCEFFSITSPGFGRISFAFLLLSPVPPSLGRRRFLWGIIGVQFVVDVATVIVSFAQSVCSAVDLTLAVFPTSLFWNLKMEWKQKAFLSSLMGLGVFAMIASIVKTIKLQAITQTSDLTYAMADPAIWWTLEANLVTLAISIPTLRPILTAWKKTGNPDGPSNFWPSYSRDPNSFQSWKPSQSNDATSHSFNPGPFKSIPETACVSDITADASANAFPMSHLSKAKRGSRQGPESRIIVQRDVTMSVTYSRAV
ncbi:hypothetical protein PT974_07634 [Cladobotryum mycophilum]|uniref:Rhodopsin domain-containing protein n=1 Tax=Cladobotryum mycophilum TaxID=491253 RepID=A0ABR0SR46_9HYPO